MKVITLDSHESTYLIEDGTRHYCLERIKLNDHPIQLVLSELNEDELSRVIQKCKSAK